MRGQRIQEIQSTFINAIARVCKHAKIMNLRNPLNFHKCDRSRVQTCEVKEFKKFNQLSQMRSVVRETVRSQKK